MSNQNFETLIKKFDNNNDKKLDLKEFILFLENISPNIK